MPRKSHLLILSISLLFGTPVFAVEEGMQSREEGRSLEEVDKEFKSKPVPSACRLIDFARAEVRPGIVRNSWILVVSGKKPSTDIEVSLNPVVYIKQPEYWEIEVVGCRKGIGLPMIVPYVVSLDLQGTVGTKGIKVIGANDQKEIPLMMGNK